MKINKEKFQDLIDLQFGGKQSECARAIGINVSNVNRLLSGGIQPGIKSLNGIMKYCERKKLNYKDYIFLE